MTDFRSFNDDVVGLKSGGAVSVYTDASEGPSIIRAQLLDSTGLPVGNGFIVGSLTDNLNAKVDALSDGGFVVTYQHRFASSATDFDIRAVIYNGDGSVLPRSTRSNRADRASEAVRRLERKVLCPAGPGHHGGCRKSPALRRGAPWTN